MCSNRQRLLHAYDSCQVKSYTRLFAHLNVCRRLLSTVFNSSTNAVDAEICAYGDILQSLGSNATDAYLCDNTRMSATDANAGDRATMFRRRIYNCLHHEKVGTM